MTGTTTRPVPDGVLPWPATPPLEPASVTTPPTPSTPGSAAPRRGTARASVPRRDIVLSLFGVGPIPARYAASAPRLHEERLRVAAVGQAGEHTPLESALRLRPELAAERSLARGARARLDPAARRLSALVARYDAVTRRLDRAADDLVVDITGRTMTRSEAHDAVDRLGRALDDSLAAGSERHRTESRWRKRVLLFFVLADFALFAYFMSRILNVDLFLPATDPIAFTTSIVFALLFTLGIAYTLHHLGHGHRAFTDDHGEVVVPTGRTSLRVQLVFAHLLMVLPGVLIGVRIVDDALLAGAAWGLAILLGVAIGIVMSGVNQMIYRTELRDGTAETDRLLHLGRALQAARRRDARLELARDRLERRAVRVAMSAERAAVRIEQRGDRIANRGPSARTLHYTRSLSGSPQEGARLPRVDPARAPFDTATAQLREPRPNLGFLRR
ncbi:hypothetical protein [Frigoribacterium faeni]|uniref:Uncharacterized protein n=1 Tax=Frigoribacterium faeni TaxID=145483 RepID=A0A7W3JHU2_9MICO|nr:hypothetical protein [Frigoribacterium faeni]MBA8813063.1 hypothetical protein [Frigoribacterium faeni]BFF14240.1 hypothetical protein GCM10025699_55430 [Microbacterium flavescens]GEK84005.1 hypothetical protein FFA01_23140 [Frigoribacterium faeni]